MAGGLGDLVIKLRADTAEFTSAMTKAAHVSEREWRKVQTSAIALGKQIGLASTVVGAVLVKMGKDAIDTADQMGKMAQKVGISSESLSALAYSAKLSDVSVEALGNGLKKLSVNMLDTQKGTGEAKDAFQALGISVEASKGNLKSSEQVLLELADKFAGMEDGAGKTALAVKLFGRAGADLIPLLNQGADGLKRNADEAKRFGLIISTDASKRAEEFNDNLTRLTASSKGFAMSVANDVLPWLNKMVEQFLEGIKQAGGFWAALTKFSSINPFRTTGESVANLTRSIEDFTRTRDELASRKVDTSAIDAQIKGFKEKLEFAKFLQRQEALAIPGGDTPGERARTTRPLAKAPALVDENANKEAIKKAEQAQKALADLIEARAKSSIDAEQFAAKERLSVLDHFHSRGFVSEEKYWRTREDIQRAAYEIERKAADQNIASRDAEAASALDKHGKKSAEYYNALKELHGAQVARNKLDAEFNAQGTRDLLAKSEASRRYAESIKEVNAQLDANQGKTAAVALRQFDEKFKPVIAQAQEIAATRGDFESSDAAADDIADISKLRGQIDAQAQFNELKERQGEITTRLGIEEERIQNSLRTGAINDVEAMQRLGAERRKAYDATIVLQRQMEQIAGDNTKGLPKLTLDAEISRAALERLGSQTELLSQKFDTILSDSFSSAFADLITGTKTAKQAFASFANSVVRALSEMYAKQVAFNVVSSMRSSGGGGGGFLNSLFSGMFGGGGGGGLIYGSAGATPGQFAIGAYGAEGGMLKGPSHSAGGIKLEAEGGEYITRKEQTQKWLPLLEAINKGDLDSVAPKTKFAQGGLVPPMFAKGGSVIATPLFATPIFAEGGLVESSSPVGMAMVHNDAIVPMSDKKGEPAIVINQSMTFGSDVNTSTLSAWGRQIKAETMSAVADSARRGGGYSKSVRGS
jgi:hypothetical protein